MTTEVQERVLCPHCRGEIRPNARLCKHCHRRLDGEAAAVSTPAAAPFAALPCAGVHRELRAFVLEREVLRGDHFDQLAGAHPTDDVVALLGRAVGAGLLTPAQVESLGVAFSAAQESQLVRLLTVATGRNLVTPVQAEQARAAFREVALRRTPEEFLIDAGLLTRDQVTSIGDAVRGAAGTLQRRMRDPEFRRAMLAGPALVIVLALVAVWIDNSTRGSNLWAIPLGLLIPAAAAVAVRWSSSTGQKAKWAGTTLGVGLLAVVLFDGLNVGRPPARIEPRCTMNGNGEGTCVFTNNHSRIAHSCGRIVAECRNVGSRESLTICSGDLEPNRVTRRSFDVPEFDRIRAQATPWGGDWRSYCEFDWVQE